MSKYYDIYPVLFKKLENTVPKLRMECKSLDEYKVWRANAKAKLHDLLGLDKMVYTDPCPEKLESVHLDGYTREKWIIYTEPEIIMTFYVLIPDGIEPGEKRPAVIATHGHSSCGKEAVVGNGFFPELQEHIDSVNYAYGVSAVKQGAIVFAPDARGFGERREKYWQNDTPGSRLASSCSYINSMAYPLGMCVAGMWTWDLMRLADYIETRDDILEGKIGTIGISGGGLQNLYFSTMDDRLQYTVISGYFYGFNESLLEMFNCSCNYVPHLWEYFDVGDIGSLIAPRPLVIETGTVDPLNGKSGLDNVKKYVEQVRSAYRLFGKEEDLFHDIHEGPHRWHGVQSIDFIKKYLMN